MFVNPEIQMGWEVAGMDNSLDNATVAELYAELERLKDNLCDLEEMHAFTFVKTSVHIGAEKAHNMQAEFEEERNNYNVRIAELERELQIRDK